MYTPDVWDIRPDGHNSFNVLPKLGVGDYQTLKDFYHFDLLIQHGYSRAKPGELFWGVAALELKAGPAILQPQVRDEEGGLILTPPGILLFLNWPGTEGFPATVDPPYFQNGVAGFTEGKGSIGWGFGGDSHIGPDGGPFTVWVSSDPITATYERRVGSDAVTKLGWWDDHIIPNPIFQVMRKEGSGPPQPVGDMFLVQIDRDGKILGYMEWVKGVPPTGVDTNGAVGLMVDGVITHFMPWKANK